MTVRFKKGHNINMFNLSLILILTLKKVCFTNVIVSNRIVTNILVACSCSSVNIILIYFSSIVKPSMFCKLRSNPFLEPTITDQWELSFLLNWSCLWCFELTTGIDRKVRHVNGQLILLCVISPPGSMYNCQFVKCSY